MSGHNKDRGTNGHRATHLSRRSHVHRWWGPKPPYVPSAEDSATIFQQLYYGWIGGFIAKAVREELTEAALPPPAREMRSYETGWKLSRQMEADMRRRHSWGPFLHTKVRYRGEPWTLGRLRWVGYMRQSDQPHSLLAGVEWDVLPSHRLSASGLTSRTHSGVVHGERLFYPSQCGRSSCEPVEGIELLEPSNDGAPVPVAPNVLWSLVKAHSYHMWVQIPNKLLADVCAVILPLLLEHYVLYLEDVHASWWKGLALVIGIFLVSVLQSCAAHKYDHMSIRAASVFENATMTLLFEKCLTISEKSLILPEMSIGRVINMAATDIGNIGDLNWYVVYFLSAPLLLLTCLVLLYRLVGWCAMVGLMVLFITFPVQILVSRVQSSIRENMAAIVDNRVRATNELFSGIRVVKFMTWEPHFLAEIEGARERELAYLKQIQHTKVGLMVINGATPMIFLAVVLILYHALGHELTPGVVFPVIALLNTLRLPFYMIPVIVSALLQCLVSARRLTLFLECENQNSNVGDVSRLFNAGVAAAFDHATVSTFTPQPLPRCRPRTRGVLRRLCGLFHPRTVPEEEWGEVLGQQRGATCAARADDGTNHATEENMEKLTADDHSAAHQLLLKELLADVSVIIPDGQLTVLVGATGSGKSTLLAALLGEYEVTHGRVWATRSIAYVPQQPWIMNATLRENILFFAPEEPKRLQEVVHACQLDSDLRLLASGMQTEIGEKGINLSGGQKARVSLARAVYADRELYLLDDPLSALDAHVGERIVADVLLGQLAYKTRILATHQLHVLSRADHVVVMSHGRILFSGTYQMYLASSASFVLHEDMLHEAEGNVDVNASDERGDSVTESDEGYTVVEQSKVRQPNQTAGVASSANEGQLMTLEEKAIGSIPWSTYMKYIKACGGRRVVAIILLVYSVTEVAGVLGSIWLSLWSTMQLHLQPQQYLYTYIGIIVCGICLLPSRSFACYTVMRIGGRNLHRRLLRATATGSMMFFDTTPIGRLINRLTRDVSSVDEVLNEEFAALLECIFSVISTLTLIAIAQPYIILAIVPGNIVYYKLLVVYTAVNREVRRLSSIARSPIFSLLDEALGGRRTIAAYRKSQIIMQEALSRLDIVYRSNYMQNIVNRWLGTRLEFVSCVIISIVALFGIIGKQTNFRTHNAGLVSLSLTVSLTLTDNINWLVRQVASVEANMNSVERIVEYTENISREQMPEMDQLVDELREKNTGCGGVAATVLVEGVSGGDGARPVETTAGWLEFRDVELRYRAGLPLVLDKVSFRIEPREKVGIVGRTGSGKSTLLLTLMRMVDICGGDIIVSGRPIRAYGLRELRQQFSMIPQDPVLFDGTVRSNLDPFLDSTPAEVWRALELVGMRGRVEVEVGGIDSRVQEGGSNYSVGQRQLLCLARALLRRGSGFILMDEATANIDHALDRQIQHTVMTAFSSHTVITIAHRLHTVAAYDKIIVMDHGVVAESGSPRELVSDPSSRFSELVSALGEQEAAKFMASVGVAVAS